MKDFLILILYSIMPYITAHAPAFPGAEGGGKVLFVVNLDQEYTNIEFYINGLVSKINMP